MFGSKALKGKGGGNLIRIKYYTLYVDVKCFSCTSAFLINDTIACHFRFLVSSLIGEALGLVGGGEGNEEDDDDDNDVVTGSDEEEKQLQNMMYNLMVNIWISSCISSNNLFFVIQTKLNELELMN